MSPQCIPLRFSSIRLPIRQQMSFPDFQDGHHGGHLRYWNGTNLAILNLHVMSMPPTKFGLNPTYRLGEDMVWTFSRWPLWWPSWILEWYNFSSSVSLCCCNASHHVSAQSDLWFGRRCGLKIFKMAVWATLDSGTKLFKQFWISMSLSFDWIQLMVWEEMPFEEFQDGSHLWYRNWCLHSSLG